MINLQIGLYPPEPLNCLLGAPQPFKVSLGALEPFVIGLILDAPGQYRITDEGEIRTADSDNKREIDNE